MIEKNEVIMCNYMINNYKTSAVFAPNNSFKGNLFYDNDNLYLQFYHTGFNIIKEKGLIIVFLVQFFLYIFMTKFQKICDL